MSTPEFRPVIPVQYETLYRTLTAIALEVGKENFPGYWSVKMGHPLRQLPRLVDRRFPQCQDMTPYFGTVVRAYDKPQPDGTVCGLTFLRHAPPKEPNRHGFAQSQWALSYNLRESDTSGTDFTLAVTLGGQRKYAAPPDYEKGADYTSHDEFMRDLTEDGRRKRLAPPRNLVQPAIGAVEIGELILHAEQALHIGRAAVWATEETS